uniref:Uncharacterized protein n=1 Tax=Lotharella oceanica TaxID=641309 RepID=A0A7S2TLI6_9EUKA|mmetsp:Transcript_18014/g.34148  ORF Transcript_18014/g.34148 Transcript_18014/m.34148 type:complete len:123 (+) Transcript_18014:83-451(+)
MGTCAFCGPDLSPRSTPSDRKDTKDTSRSTGDGTDDLSTDGTNDRKEAEKKEEKHEDNDAPPENFKTEIRGREEANDEGDDNDSHGGGSGLYPHGGLYRISLHRLEIYDPIIIPDDIYAEDR